MGSDCSKQQSLTAHEAERVSSLYDSIDTDVSGFLDPQEILKWQWDQDEDAAGFLAAVDVNGDGKVSREEITAHLEKQKAEQSPDEFAATLERYEFLGQRVRFESERTSEGPPGYSD
eukprot:TRINITY_DN2128_c0_g1_i1.p1 TRINITY_DN2128_c0_g1~~TRINITY_DN2128_c0_g1_i1.p1  ORF type:complete len:117 (+),score=29.91 TRINITY_DN2128_c0_g1_i1:204-554(+)